MATETIVEVTAGSVNDNYPPYLRDAHSRAFLTNFLARTKLNHPVLRRLIPAEEVEAARKMIKLELVNAEDKVKVGMPEHVIQVKPVICDNAQLLANRLATGIEEAKEESIVATTLLAENSIEIVEKHSSLEGARIATKPFDGRTGTDLDEKPAGVMGRFIGMNAVDVRDLLRNSIMDDRKVQDNINVIKNCIRLGKGTLHSARMMKGLVEICDERMPSDGIGLIFGCDSYLTTVDFNVKKKWIMNTSNDANEIRQLLERDGVFGYNYDFNELTQQFDYIVCPFSIEEKVATSGAFRDLMLVLTTRLKETGVLYSAARIVEHEDPISLNVSLANYQNGSDYPVRVVYELFSAQVKRSSEIPPAEYDAFCRLTGINYDVVRPRRVSQMEKGAWLSHSFTIHELRFQPIDNYTPLCQYDLFCEREVEAFDYDTVDELGTEQKRFSNCYQWRTLSSPREDLFELKPYKVYDGNGKVDYYYFEARKMGDPPQDGYIKAYELHDTFASAEPKRMTFPISLGCLRVVIKDGTIGFIDALGEKIPSNCLSRYDRFLFVRSKLPQLAMYFVSSTPIITHRDFENGDLKNATVALTSTSPHSWNVSWIKTTDVDLLRKQVDGGPWTFPDNLCGINTSLFEKYIADGELPPKAYSDLMESGFIPIISDVGEEEKKQRIVHFAAMVRAGGRAMYARRAVLMIYNVFLSTLQGAVDRYIVKR